MGLLNNVLQQFQTIVDGRADLKSLQTITDGREILAWQLHRSEYPCLVVEVPQVDLDKEAGDGMEFHGAFVVLDGQPTGKTPAYYWNVLDTLLDIAKGVADDLWCESEREDEYTYDLDTTLQPIKSHSKDNAYGWRATFTISYD